MKDEKGGSGKQVARAKRDRTQCAWRALSSLVILKQEMILFNNTEK